MTELLCKRCGKSSLVIYNGEPLCSPCAVVALGQRTTTTPALDDEPEPDTQSDGDP